MSRVWFRAVSTTYTCALHVHIAASNTGALYNKIVERNVVGLAVMLRKSKTIWATCSQHGSEGGLSANLAPYAVFKRKSQKF